MRSSVRHEIRTLFSEKCRCCGIYDTEFKESQYSHHEFICKVCWDENKTFDKENLK